MRPRLFPAELDEKTHEPDYDREVRGRRSNRPRLPLRQELVPLACFLAVGFGGACQMSESFPPTWRYLILGEVIVVTVYVGKAVYEGRRYSRLAREREASRL